MVKVNIVQVGQQTDCWTEWVRGLSCDGFEVRYFNPLAIELQQFDARPGEVVLFNGGLPNLPKALERTRRRNPEAHIVSASESSQTSNTDSYGIFHISGPVSPMRFAKTLRRIIGKPSPSTSRC